MISKSKVDRWCATLPADHQAHRETPEWRASYYMIRRDIRWARLRLDIREAIRPILRGLWWGAQGLIVGFIAWYIGETVMLLHEALEIYVKTH